MLHFFHPRVLNRRPASTSLSRSKHGVLSFVTIHFLSLITEAHAELPVVEFLPGAYPEPRMPGGAATYDL